MLEELKSKIYRGKKGDIVYFLSEIIGKKTLAIKVIKKLCEYSLFVSTSDAEALVVFSSYLKFVEIKDDKVKLSLKMRSLLNDKKAFIQEIIKEILCELFNLIPNTDIFQYDLIEKSYIIRHEYIPLSLTIFRDILVNLLVFVIKRAPDKTSFILNSDYEETLTNIFAKSQRKITLEQLMRTLEDQAKKGEEAELFVMEYETKRLGGKNPKSISTIDVAAGFDIMSYESINSTDFDRFIEVKAIGKNISFYWTANEVAKAKLIGNSYYIYLVDMNQAKVDINYSPLIIPNPAAAITLPKWLIESDSFFVRYLS